PTGWVLSTPASLTLKLDDLAGAGHAGPAHTLIGPPGAGGKYTAGNGSIDGNKPHNPFLFGTESFTLNFAGFSSDSKVTGVTFQFGTTDGSGRVTGIPSVPEPSSIVLSGMGLIGLAFGFRIRKWFYRSAVEPA